LTFEEKNTKKKRTFHLIIIKLNDPYSFILFFFIQGLWLRLEDAEIFFYSTSRINSDQRFQIEQRPILHIINGTSSYEITTYSLTIDDVRLSDDGTYSCQADNRIIKLFVLNIVGKHDHHKFMTSPYITYDYIIAFFSI
jgi:hypothetical protein